MECDLIQELASKPNEICSELPVTSALTELPFEKLIWENFEKFCFQLGSLEKDCRDTSYIYGRKGQKQYGIDLYFNKDGVIDVWQIKRYQKFKASDVEKAVNEFLKHKWKDEASIFTLCVSNYLDDVDVVDMINTQTKILKEDHDIKFLILGSDKLTMKARNNPELISVFFGEHWLNALNLKIEDKKQNIAWHDQNGNIVDSEKIHEIGIFKTKVNDNTIYAQHELPGGKEVYAEFDANTGSVSNIKFPYPLIEYKVDIPDDLILKKEHGDVTLNNKNYYAKIIYLKWGERITFLYSSSDMTDMIDIDITTKSIIDNTNKIIKICEV